MITTNAESSMESALERMLAPEEAPVEETAEAEEATEETQEPETEETSEQEPEETEESEEETEETEEPDEEDTDEDSDGPTDLYTVKVDGEEVQVSLDDLKRGYSGQQYVQKGMKQAAEIQKEAQTQAQTLQKERAKVHELAQAIIGGQLKPPPTEPDPSLLNTDPLQYHQLRVQYDEDAKSYKESVAQFKQLQEQNQAAEQQAIQAYAQEQGRMLTAIDADWADAEKAAAKFDNLTKGGVEHYGYDESEVRSVMDHRAILVLQDALAYREMKAKGLPAAEEKLARAKQAKSSAKPRRASKSRQQQTQQQRLKKTGDINDALALMFK